MKEYPKFSHLNNKENEECLDTLYAYNQKYSKEHIQIVKQENKHQSQLCGKGCYTDSVNPVLLEAVQSCRSSQLVCLHILQDIIN